MTRGLRTLNAISNGTISGATLETQLANGGVKSDFDSLMTLPGTTTVMAASTTAVTTIGGSTTALNSVMNFPFSRTAISNATSALAALYANPTAVTQMAGNRDMQTTLSVNSISRNYTLSSGRAALGSFLTGANGDLWYAQNSWRTTASLNYAPTVQQIPSRPYMDMATDGNGRFVAVAWTAPSNAFSITTSVDGGLNWTNTGEFTGSEGYWISVTYGNGRFVAVSNNGSKSATSTDGITWTASATDSNLLNAFNVAFGNGVFIVAQGAVGGTRNTCLRSTDGLTWTPITLPRTGGWSKAIFGNNVWVILATDGSFARSTDNGLTWTSVSVPTSTSWYHGVYAQNKFTVITGYNPLYASGSTTSTAVLTSTDNGLTWTEASPLPSSGGWGGIVFANNAYVIVPSNTSTHFPQSSPDGITWRQWATSSSRCVGPCFDGRNSILTMSYEVQRLPHIFPAAYVSNNTQLDFIQLSGNPEVSGAAFGNNMFVMGGRNYVYTSTDGLTWNRYICPLFFNQVPRIVYGNGRFVAICQNSGTPRSYLATSTDGITWTAVTLPTSRVWVDVAFGNGRFVILSGHNKFGGSSSETVAWSTDGLTWTGATLPASRNFGNITFSSGRFIVTYFNTNNGASTPVSTNGSTWTDLGTGYDATVYTISSPTQTLSIPVASTTTLYLTSNGGDSWTSSSTGVSSMPYITGAYGNGLWIVVGDSGSRILTSTNGTTWTSQTPSGAQRSVNTAVYGNGYFIIGQRYASVPDTYIGVINL